MIVAGVVVVNAAIACPFTASPKSSACSWNWIGLFLLTFTSMGKLKYAGSFMDAGCAMNGMNYGKHNFQIKKLVK